MIELARLENAVSVILCGDEVLSPKMGAAVARLLRDDSQIVIKPTLLDTGLHDRPHDLASDDGVENEFGDVAIVGLATKTNAIVTGDGADGADVNGAVDGALRHFGRASFDLRSPLVDPGLLDACHETSPVGGVATSTVEEGEGSDND